MHPKQDVCRGNTIRLHVTGVKKSCVLAMFTFGLRMLNISGTHYSISLCCLFASSWRDFFFFFLLAIATCGHLLSELSVKEFWCPHSCRPQALAHFPANLQTLVPHSRDSKSTRTRLSLLIGLHWQLSQSYRPTSHCQSGSPMYQVYWFNFRYLPGQNVWMGVTRRFGGSR